MRHSISNFIIALAVVISLVLTGVCPALATKAGKTTCTQKANPEKGITLPAPGTCRVASCPTRGKHLLLLPETSFRRSHNENVYAGMLPAPGSSHSAEAPGPHPAGEFFRERSFACHPPPPSYCLHCVYLC